MNRKRVIPIRWGAFRRKDARVSSTAAALFAFLAIQIGNAANIEKPVCLNDTYHIMNGCFAPNSYQLRKLRHAMEELINAGVVKAKELSTNHYLIDCEATFDADVALEEYFTLAPFEEMMRVWNLDKNNRERLLHLFLLYVSLINREEGYGYASMDFFMTCMNVTKSTIVRLTKILEENKVIFVSHSATVKTVNHFSLYEDREYLSWTENSLSYFPLFSKYRSMKATLARVHSGLYIPYPEKARELIEEAAGLNEAILDYKKTHSRTKLMPFDLTDLEILCG